ncbi:MAG TPA: formate dehydrogenase accessory protein FdhE [Terriglobales bacterium]|nr:formate dehydrogenase accessory protein FdhE [Terriglobales bacterium]
MPQTGWQRRAERAEELALRHTFAADVLRFYSVIAKFQAKLSEQLSKQTASPSEERPLSGGALPPPLQNSFDDFLAVLQDHAPAPVLERTQDLKDSPGEVKVALLTNFWSGTHPQRQSIDEFLARAFLQPYAEFVRQRVTPAAEKHTSTLCPFCGRRPGVGVLRPLGEGGLRSLVCSFCLYEWPFRRILCPGCGEEEHHKLPVFTAAALPHVRVEGCDSCKTYIKTVDLTRNGLAEPVVDEIAAIPLDLWAQERGYAKLQANLMQM